jgi:hypothetical protein
MLSRKIEITLLAAENKSKLNVKFTSNAWNVTLWSVFSPFNKKFSTFDSLINPVAAFCYRQCIENKRQKGQVFDLDKFIK